MAELREQIKVQKADIAAVVETWAHTGIGDAELAVEGYVTYRVDRKEQCGGGVILFVKDTLASQLVDTLNTENYKKNYEDCVWCTVVAHRLKLLIGVCYRSPASSVENNARLLKVLDKAVNGGWGDRVMILGDFNFREIDFNRYTVNTGVNTEAETFFRKTQDLYLVQNETDDTKIRDGTRPSTLDYIFTDEELLVDNLLYEAPLGMSDHVCLIWDYVVDVEEAHSQCTKLNYWNGDYHQINQDLEAIDWQKLLQDSTVESSWKIFKTILSNSVERNVPVKNEKYKKQRNPWLTKSTRRSLSKRDKAWWKYRECRTVENLRHYKMLRNEAGRKVKADQAYYKKRILKLFKGQPKKFYGYMQNLRTVKEKVSQISKGNGEFTASDTETAQALGDYFSSVFIDEGEYTQGHKDKVNMDTGLGDIRISRDTVIKKFYKNFRWIKPKDWTMYTQQC